MREIKFRAWDTKENKWFEPIYEAYKGRLLDMHITLSGQPCIRSIEQCSDMREAERYVLQQYTGLKDKNGEEIYEGDILRHIRHTASIGVMEWSNYLAAWTKFHPHDEFEVIGNVHETPELLNK